MPKYRIKDEVLPHGGCVLDTLDCARCRKQSKRGMVTTADGKVVGPMVYNKSELHKTPLDANGNEQHDRGAQPLSDNRSTIASRKFRLNNAPRQGGRLIIG